MEVDEIFYFVHFIGSLSRTSKEFDDRNTLVALNIEEHHKDIFTVIQSIASLLQTYNCFTADPFNFYVYFYHCFIHITEIELCIL